MQKKLLILALCFCVVGCVSTQNKPITAAGSANLKQNKSLTIVQRESPSFVALTSGKGMFAVVGVAAAASEGNQLVKRNNIIDPSVGIAKSLAKKLNLRYGVKISNVVPLVETGNISKIVQSSGNADYVLDVVSNGWGYMYDGFNFGDYFVGYSAKLRLIDTKTGEVISKGFCPYEAKKAGKQAVSHDKLLANNAAYIKQEIAAAANFCAKQFANNLF